MRLRLRQVPFVLWLLVLAIAINVLQFSVIRKEAGKYWGALYRLDDPDIFAVYADIGRRPDDYNVFTALGSIAPGATIITNNASFFRPGAVGRYFVLSSGKSTEIKVTNKDLDKYIEQASLASPYLVKSGSISRSSRVNLEIPQVKWEIYAKNSLPMTMLFVGDRNSSKWQFIDIDLLDKKSRDELLYGY